MVLQRSFTLFQASKGPLISVSFCGLRFNQQALCTGFIPSLFLSPSRSYGAERFEDGASQINKSDMFFGDDGDITDEQLKHMDEITMKNVRFVKMTEGDVVLLDNYKCMHGRNVFDGTRKHAVAWFEGWEGEDAMKQNKKSLEAIAA